MLTDSLFSNQRIACINDGGILHRWSRPYANYSLRNPECVSLGLRAVQPTQMFTGMKRCGCLVAAL